MDGLSSFLFLGSGLSLQTAALVLGCLGELDSLLLSVHDDHEDIDPDAKIFNRDLDGNGAVGNRGAEQVGVPYLSECIENLDEG